MTDRFSEANASRELADFFDCPGLPAALDNARSTSRPRAELARELADQARRLGAHPNVLTQAERLAVPGSAAVVTGQQAGLLLGPNYTIAKSMGARSLAARLDSKEQPVVPVFWLASQDHDVQEVDHTFVLDLDEQLHRISLEMLPGVPASRQPWWPGWADNVAAQLARGRWQPEFLEQVTGLLAAAGEKANNWADFFAALYYGLLGEDAPLLLDPAQPGIAAMFRGTLAREIENPTAGVESINEAGAELRRMGFTPQLGRGRGATNLFILTKGNSGVLERQLLRFDGARFQAGKEDWSREELLAVLDAEPGRITPAAGLRPIVQDALLPTAAFVVGPGELKYIAQLRGVYRQHGVNQPVIWPRAEMTVIEPPVARIMANLGLEPDAYAGDPDRFERDIMLRHSGAARHFEQGLASLQEAQAELGSALLGIDPTLQGAVDRHSARVAGSIALLQEKAAAAALRRSDVLGSQFGRLRQHLLPAGSMQERLISPVSFVLKFGLEPMRRLYRQVPESGSVNLEP